ncbi:MAG: SIR2 family protein [Actinomycetota bacterium]|nr:SIR2 family protein [Actinomycetota bacterium]
MSDASASPSDLAGTPGEFLGDVNQLARVVDVQGAQLAWFLGAGASAMSDIPTAGALILRFKQELYCAAHQLDVQDINPGDPRTRALIEGYFDGRNGLPPLGDPEEYSVAFETAYPSPDLRADLIADLCRGRGPNYGHYLLAALMAAGRLHVVFSTNFDDLVEAGAHSLFELAGVTPRPSLAVAGLGEPELASRALQKSSFPLVAKLHGDFRSVRLKNSVAELAVQDVEMRHVLRSALGRFGLVVAGYSGRDRSVMEVLTDALDDKGSFPAGIYWCHRPNDPPGQEVTDFLTAARTAGRTAFAVPVDNFIELAGAIERGVRLPENLRRCLADRRPTPVLTTAPLPTGPTRPYPILRLNALPLTRLPNEVRTLQEQSPCDLAEAQQAIRAGRVRGLIARRSGGQLIAVGHEAQLSEALRPLGVSVTNRTETLNWDTEILDPADHGLALDALTLGLGRTDGLRHVLARRGHQVRVADAKSSSLARLKSACGGTLSGTVPKTSLHWAEAVGLNIERRQGVWWLLVVPEIWISPPRGVPSPEDRAVRRAEQLTSGAFVQKRRATRYNRDANAILDAWVRLLCTGLAPREIKTWNLGPTEGLDPIFEVDGHTAFSRPLQVTAQPS